MILPSGNSLIRVPSGNTISFIPFANSIALVPFFSILWMVPSGKMLSSSPSAKMHFIVPSGNLLHNYLSWIKDLHNFFRAIWEMLFYLLVSKLEYLESIRECCLGCFGFSKIINYSLIRISLFDIIIIEINDCITVWELFTLNPIVKYYFLFAILINSLDFSIITYYLLYYSCILWLFIMIHLWEFHVIIFFLYLFFFFFLNDIILR